MSWKQGAGRLQTQRKKKKRKGTCSCLIWLVPVVCIAELLHQINMYRFSKINICKKLQGWLGWRGIAEATGLPGAAPGALRRCSGGQPDRCHLREARLGAHLGQQALGGTRLPRNQAGTGVPAKSSTWAAIKEGG